MNRNIVLITTALALSLSWVGCKKSSTVVKTTTSMPTAPVELKLKWPAGRHMVQGMDIKQTTEIAVPGMAAPMKQDMDMGQKFALTVLQERADGGHEVEMEFLGTRMVMKMGDKTMVNYDSAKKSKADAKDPVGDIFSKIIKSKIRFVLDASNKVERVEGIDALQAKLAGGAGNDPTGIFKSMFNEQYFKQMMEHSQSLPGKPVEPGDAWPVKMEIAMGDMGTMIMEYTYTFQKWESRNGRYCARIGIQGTLNSKPGQTPNANGMSMSIENGKSSGETWFDLDMGMFVDTVLDQDMKAVMTVPMPKRGNAPAGKPQTLSTLMKQNVTIKLESVN